MLRNRFTISGVAIFAFASIASSEVVGRDCSKIQNKDERLACYDAASRPQGKADQKRPAAEDPVIVNARSVIRRKLKDPNSARFGTMSRAMRPNVRGEPTDTICGYVNAKNSFGGYTGERPFVYFVKDQSVYVVDGGGKGVESQLAATVYNNFCTKG